jgi:hypothetical protein
MTKTGLIVSGLIVILFYGFIQLALSSLFSNTLPNDLHTSVTLAFKANNTSSNSITANPQLSHVTIETDKKSYGFLDYIEISGAVNRVVEGKTIRLDIYLPNGQVAPSSNGTLSNIHLKPRNDGSFFYTFQIPSLNGFDKGLWTISTTYLRNTTEAKFTVR